MSKLKLDNAHLHLYGSCPKYINDKFTLTHKTLEDTNVAVGQVILVLWFRKCAYTLQSQNSLSNSGCSNYL